MGFLTVRAIAVAACVTGLSNRVEPLGEEVGRDIVVAEKWLETLRSSQVQRRESILPPRSSLSAIAGPIG